MTTGTAAAPKTRRSVPVWLETALLLVLALAVAAVVKTFLVQMFFVPSGSMRPLLTNDDRILVQKVSYWGDGHVERGDVVVFADPGSRWLGPTVEPTTMQKALAKIGLYPTGGHLVKRVVGVGGDRVTCCDAEGRVRVNGVPLDEDDYVIAGAEPSERRFDVRVPEGRIWVMGDNRPDSQDSRFFGVVDRELIVGRAWLRYFPLDRVGFVGHPTYAGLSDAAYDEAGSSATIQLSMARP